MNNETILIIVLITVNIKVLLNSPINAVEVDKAIKPLKPNK